MLQVLRHGTVVGVNGLQGGVQKVLTHAPDHVHHLRTERSALACIVAVQGVGEQIVLQHIGLRHAQRRQNQRSSQAGAVFACGAVEHQGRVLSEQVREQLGKAVRVLAHKAPVGDLHPVQSVLGRDGLALLQLRVQILHQRGLNGQVVTLGAGPFVSLRRAFLHAPKVKAAADLQRLKLPQV